MEVMDGHTLTEKNLLKHTMSMTIPRVISTRSDVISKELRRLITAFPRAVERTIDEVSEKLPMSFPSRNLHRFEFLAW